VREAKNPAWFQTKNKEGFFARRGGLGTRAFGPFPQTIQPRHNSCMIKSAFAGDGLDF